MTSYLGFLLYGNLVLFSIAYLYLFKIRKLIGFQLGMNITMAASGMMGLSTGIILIYQFPLHFVWVTIISTLTGIITGAIYGGLFDYQTLLTGYANGVMIGIMSPMIGAAANNNIAFIWFIEIIIFLSLPLLLTSAKKT